MILNIKKSINKKTKIAETMFATNMPANKAAIPKNIVKNAKTKNALATQHTHVSRLGFSPVINRNATANINTIPRIK